MNRAEAKSADPVPLVCKNNKSKIRAYQCKICDCLDIDDFTDKLFCRAGYYPGCGDPDGCRAMFRPITNGGRIGPHR